MNFKDKSLHDKGLKMFSKEQIQIEDDLIVNKKRKLDKGSDELLEEDNCKILF